MDHDEIYVQRGEAVIMMKAHERGKSLDVTNLANALALATLGAMDFGKAEDAIVSHYNAEGWGEPSTNYPDFDDFPYRRIPTDPSQSIYTTHFAPSLPRPREPKPTAVAKRRANAKAARKARKQNRK